MFHESFKITMDNHGLHPVSLPTFVAQTVTHAARCSSFVIHTWPGLHEGAWLRHAKFQISANFFCEEIMRTRVVEQFMIHLYFCRWLNTLEFLTRMCEAKTGTKTEDWRKDAKSKSKFVRSCLCHLGSSSLQMKWRACSSSNRLTWSFNSSITCKTVSQDAGARQKVLL